MICTNRRARTKILELALVCSSRFVSILASCVVLFQASCVSTSSPALRQIGPVLDRSPESAPNLTLTGIDGQRYSISQYRGQVIIVSLWAPWCIPCRQELPALGHLYDTFKKDGLVVLGIGVEDSPISIRGSARTAGVRFPILVDTASASLQLFKTSGVPTALVIDRQGKFVLFPDPATGVATPWIIGPREWDSPEIAQQIAGLLAE
jgi:peroxiredoxin